MSGESKGVIEWMAEHSFFVSHLWSRNLQFHFWAWTLMALTLSWPLISVQTQACIGWKVRQAVSVPWPVVLNLPSIRMTHDQRLRCPQSRSWFQGKRQEDCNAFTFRNLSLSNLTRMIAGLRLWDNSSILFHSGNAGDYVIHSMRIDHWMVEGEQVVYTGWIGERTPWRGFQSVSASETDVWPTHNTLESKADPWSSCTTWPRTACNVAQQGFLCHIAMDSRWRGQLQRSVPELSLSSSGLSFRVFFLKTRPRNCECLVWRTLVFS